MSDTHLVNPRDYDVDLHDAYASFMGYFERKGIPWWNHSYAGYFYTFNDFLSFGWGAIVVTDKRTGRGHVCVRSMPASFSSSKDAPYAGGGGHEGRSGGGGVGGHSGNGNDGPMVIGNYGTLQQFAKMVRTRFGDTLPKLTSQLPVEPNETKPRVLRYINDSASFKRLAATIPAAELHAKKKKARSGDPSMISDLWSSRNRKLRLNLCLNLSESPSDISNRDGWTVDTFLALEITWWEKGNGVILEAGLAACRCRNIDALDAWPPIPDDNYRRSHYVVSEWLDKRTNTHHHMPSQPRSYAHGESSLVSMSTLEKILNSRLGDLRNVQIPSNCLIVDVSNLERSLYEASLIQHSPSNTPPGGLSQPGSAGASGHSLQLPLPRQGRPNLQRSSSTPLSLKGMCNQLSVPVPPHIPAHNSGNAAFYMLLVFQLLVDREATIPPVLTQQPQQHAGHAGPYPHLQIYPPQQGGSLPLPQSRQRVNSGMRRAQTMYWDEVGVPGLDQQGMTSSMSRMSLNPEAMRSQHDSFGSSRNLPARAPGRRIESGGGPRISSGM